MTFTFTEDVADDLRRAVEVDHPDCGNPTCGISAALRAGFPLVAADILRGAGDYATLESALAFHAGAADPRPSWADWTAWADAHGLTCASCGLRNYFDDVPSSAWTCGNCAHSNRAPEPWRRGPAVRAALAALRDVATVARLTYRRRPDPRLWRDPIAEAQDRAFIDAQQRAALTALLAVADVARAARAGEWES